MHAGRHKRVWTSHRGASHTSSPCAAFSNHTVDTIAHQLNLNSVSQCLVLICACLAAQAHQLLLALRFSVCSVQFDECHKAKNLMNEQGNPTLTGVAVRHIQDKLPSAGILYSSATGISEPNNMAYMVRLGNFGHKSMTDLIKSLIESGLGASELFSCSLKSQGIYVARCVSTESEFETWFCI